MPDTSVDQADEAIQLTPKQREDVLKRCKERLAQLDTDDGKNRESARRDTEFLYVPGKQWDPSIKQKRESWGDPCLEFNQLPQFVNQVVNDQRQNRPGIRVHAAGGDASKEVAEIIQGMIRGIEYDSQAEAVYDCGYHGAVTGGRGYWRVKCEYEGPESFNQVLRLERCPNPDMVRLDPHYRDPDGGDRNWGYVLEKVPRDEFKDRWPDAEELDFEQKDGLWYPDDKHVLVADYYERVITYRELLALANGTIGFRDDLEKVYGPGTAIDTQVIKKRKSESYEVRWYTVAGGDQILETHYWPGTLIPIVCTMGDEAVVDGTRIFQGLITRAKSSQAMFNYGMTNQAIHLALTPRAPWVAAVGQIKGLEDIWNEANNRNWSVLPYNPIDVEGTVLGAPQRQPPATPDSGWLNWTQQMQGLMRSTIGMYENSLGLHGQETSGRAILAREKQGDNSTYHYADNLARAIALTGRIIVECIPYYYDAQRIVYVIGEDDARSEATINQEVPGTPDPMTGAIQAITKNDVRVGKYAVTVAAGPGYETKRQEMAELLMQLVQADPMVLQAAGDIIVSVQDIPEADQIAERIRALLPPPVQQVIAAKEAKQDPKFAAMMQGLQQQIQQAQQQVQQLTGQLQQAGMENAQLKADKSASIAASNARAQAAMSDVQGKQQDAAIRMQEALTKRLDDQEKRSLEHDKVLVDLMKVLAPFFMPQPATLGPEMAIADEALEGTHEPDADDVSGQPIQ